MKKHIGILKNDNLVEIIIYTANNDFLSSAKMIHYPEDNLFEISGPVARSGFGKELYLVMAMYAHENNAHIMSARDGATRSAAIKHWESFYEESDSKVIIPDFYNETILADDSEEDALPFTHAYQIKPNSDYKNNIINLLESKNGMSLLEETRDFFGDSYGLDSNKWINDDFPLNEANIDSGLNIVGERDIDSLEEQYYTGKCMFLAIALHEKFGLEIQAAVTKSGNELVIDHAWVNIGGISDIDICGIHDCKSEWASGSKIIQSLNTKEIKKIIGEIPKDRFEENMINANSVMNNYLIPKYNLTKDIFCQDNLDKNTVHIVESTPLNM